MLVAATLFFVMYAPELIAQNTVIAWSAVDMGFSWAVSPTSVLQSVAGQTIIERSSAGTTTLASGFLAGVRRDSVNEATGIILYSRSGASGRTIWMRATDGSFDTMVVSSGAWPRLSHNGRYILFHKGNGDPVFSNLYFYDLQTRSDTLLFELSAHLICYDWFDDDYHVVFDHVCGVYMINRDRTGFTTLYVVDCYDDAPVTRPGRWGIAHHNSFQGGIVVTDSLGVNRHFVANTGAGDYWPSWSPDGQWIAFMRKLNDTTYNYYKIHPDGTGLTPLTSFTTTQATFSNGGAWAPDGSKIIVAASINRVPGMYAIASDGSNGIGLIQTTGGDPIDFVGTVTGYVNVQLTSVREQVDETPTRFQLFQNYPNPFNPSTRIPFTVQVSGFTSLKVYDVLGREVATLVNEVKAPGHYEVTWNAAGFSSGVYFYRLRAGEFVATRKLVLLR